MSSNTAEHQRNGWNHILSNCHILSCQSCSEITQIYDIRISDGAEDNKNFHMPIFININMNILLEPIKVFVIKVKILCSDGQMDSFGQIISQNFEKL